jgi:hypothetical protein
MPDSRHPNVETALRLAERGYSVFPCRGRGDRAKCPMPAIQWRAASTHDICRVSDWWRHWPDAAPGLDLAKSGLIVIDADRHGGPDGVLALGDMMADHGYDPSPVPTVSTPRNGTHFFYRQPPGKCFGNADSGLYKGRMLRDMGINIRGDGRSRSRPAPRSRAAATNSSAISPRRPCCRTGSAPFSTCRRSRRSRRCR